MRRVVRLAGEVPAVETARHEAIALPGVELDRTPDMAHAVLFAQPADGGVEQIGRKRRVGFGLEITDAADGRPRGIHQCLADRRGHEYHGSSCASGHEVAVIVAGTTKMIGAGRELGEREALDGW